MAQNALTIFKKQKIDLKIFFKYTAFQKAMLRKWKDKLLLGKNIYYVYISKNKVISEHVKTPIIKWQKGN